MAALAAERFLAAKGVLREVHQIDAKARPRVKKKVKKEVRLLPLSCVDLLLSSCSLGVLLLFLQDYRCVCVCVYLVVKKRLC